MREVRAPDGDRTRNPKLGRLVLYHLSYQRTHFFYLMAKYIINLLPSVKVKLRPSFPDT